jgi:tetratricopeptide (TPR) repeat protein
MKRILFVIVILTIVVSIVIVFGRPTYRRHQEARAVARARVCLGQGDFRNASLHAQQALAKNPRSADACRVMADLTELAGAPQALDWRQRVAEFAPTLPNKLALAAAAIQVQRPPCPLAAGVLAALAPAAQASAPYHVVCAELALKQHDLREAETHFREAVRLDATNELYRLNLAALQLRSTNQGVAFEARKNLQGLCANPELAPVALRWLIVDRLDHQDIAGAGIFSRQLMADARATLSDRLQHLTILRAEGHLELEGRLPAEQRRVVTNAAAIYSVAGWMRENGRAAESLQWLTNLPPGISTKQPVPLAVADCLIALTNWAGLEFFLEPQKWGDLDFLRLGLLSLSAREQQRIPLSEVRWKLAVRQAAGQLGPLLALLAMTERENSGASPRREDLLWTIGQKYPQCNWAFQELQKLCTTAGDTLQLNRLYAAMTGLEPKNIAAKNNYAATAMLLRTNLAQAHDLAQGLYRAFPGEAVVVSTYAFSLHLQGRTREGLAALDSLPSLSLEYPDVALYYGLLLAADGQKDRARQFLARSQAATLLPEEKALLTEALKVL